MFATINLPGSRHFDYFGPGTRKECEDWLKETCAKLEETELLTSTLPRQIISNKAAEKWKYRDGNKVFSYFRRSH